MFHQSCNTPYYASFLCFKSIAMLNLFLQVKKDSEALPQVRRPYLASEVTDITQCEYWRRQIIREVARDVAAIQNASLGEHKIRDLNDNINKLLREKKHWERQIKALGGPNYEISAPKIVDQDGRRALGTEGYYYFGAAKELPGIRELFEKKQVTEVRHLRRDLQKLVDAEYFGFRDEDDGELVKVEADAEARIRGEAIKEFYQGKGAEEAHMQAESLRQIVGHNE